MIQNKIFFDEKDPTGVSYSTPFTVYGSYEGRLWSKTPSGTIKYYTQNSDLSVYATTGSNSFNGNQTVTGSLIVTGGITGSATTASYVEYASVANKPALVSSSVQIVEYNVFATTGSNQFDGSQAITGSLTVTGQVIAQTLNVQQVTSSIVYSSGSNIFGNTLGNTQQFTGSLQVSGSSHYLLGSVGIGTVTPEGKLTIQGTSAELPNSGTTANSLIQLKSNLNTELNIGLNTVSGDYGAYIQATDNNLAVPYGLYLQPNGGNVGIGTIKARGLLQLFGPEIAAYKTYTGQGNTGGGDTIINAYRLDAASLYLRVTDIVALGDDTNNRGSSIRLMTTNTSGVTSAALTIAPTGASTLSNTTSGNALRLYTSYASGRALNFGFSDGSILPTAAFYIGNQTAVGVFIGDETTTNGLYVKANGNTVVGGTTPLATAANRGNLTINGTNTSILSFSTSDALKSYVYNDGTNMNFNSGNGVFTFEANNVANSLYISGSGVGIVGIGTASPRTTHSLTLAGNASSTTGGITLRQNTTDTLYIGNPSVVNTTDIEIWNPRDGFLRFATNNTEQMRITSGGAILIGSTSNDYGKLDVTVSPSSYRAALGLGFNTNSGEGNSVGISFKSKVSLSGVIWENARIATITESVTSSIYGALAFYTMNATTLAERMRISPGGVVQITNAGSLSNSIILSPSISSITSGTTALIQINQSFAIQMDTIGGTAYTIMGGDSAMGGIIFRTYSSSTYANRFFFYSDGTAYNSTGTWGNSSDIRLKQDIVDANSQWDDIKSLKFKKYRLKKDVQAELDSTNGFIAPTHFGLIAQDVEQTSPGLIEEVDNEDGGKTKMIKTSIMLMKSVKALQEAMTKIETLEAENDALKEILQRNNIS